MKIVKGTFNGLGEVLRIGVGFIPDKVIVRNHESATGAEIQWDGGRTVEQAGGILISGTDMAWTALPSGEGVAPYRGGEEFDVVQTTYLVRDPSPDKRAKGSGGTVKSWTLDTPASMTGHFDSPVDTGQVGESSQMCIGGKWYRIAAVSGDGTSDDNVTIIGEAPPSGSVDALYGMYDFIGIKAGMSMPDGFVINNTAVTVSGELCSFEAWSLNDEQFCN